MDVKYKQVADFPDYFGTSKPSGDAAIDLRILSVDVVSLGSRDCGRLYDVSKPTELFPISPLTVSGHPELIIQTDKVYLVHTGICVSFPEGHVGLLSLRSSAGRSGICMLNSPGIIDHGYHGELMLPIFNALSHSIVVPVGYRIAQLTIVECAKINLIMESNLGDSERGERGFGSTGAI